MTLSEAIRVAIRAARHTADHRYIVYEEQEYFVARDEELDTYFAGAQIIGAVDPDGQYSSAH